MVEHVKKRRITKKDWDQVQVFVSEEYKRRSTSSYRKQHESIWKEVDRQVRMEAVQPQKNDRNDEGIWHAEVELGELARASEILSADIRRLTFPSSRMWFEAHSEIKGLENDPVEQKKGDGIIRSFMSQQHSDFGFKSRIDLSVKEALHHGSFVAEVLQENQLMIHDGKGIESRSAPVWKPYSMWNAFPDPSASVISNTIYTGSMILRDYVPLYQLKEMAKGDGWFTVNLDKVPRRKNKTKSGDTDDVELIKYYGDIVIKRQDGDIVLPNSKVILGNDTIVYYAPIELKFPPIIYNGYERLDVRDPYYTSPIIKLSPMQKMASHLAGKHLDSVDLKVEPPIIYSESDPSFVQNGGPKIFPGAKTPTKGSANYQIIETGDPTFALEGLREAMSQIRMGTSTENPRGEVEKTKAEVIATEQRGEARVVDFVDKLEFSLKTFLYMQHELNKRNLDRYPFYNSELDSPDFMWATKSKLPENIHFEIVGAKGVLGEQERSQKMTAVTMMAASSPIFEKYLNPVELLKEAYMDAGAKNPERFLNIPDPEEDQKLKDIMAEVEQQAKALIDQYQNQIFELEKEIAIQKAVNEAKVVEAQMKSQSQIETSQFKAQIQGEIDLFKTQLELAKSGGNQVSVKEIGQIVDSLQKVLETQEMTLNSENKDKDSKLEAMNERLEKMLESNNKLTDFLSKPVTIQRDERGNIIGASR